MAIRSPNDTVLAFDGAGVAGGDRIDLSGIDANTGAGGNQAFRFGGTGIGQVSVVEAGATRSSAPTPTATPPSSSSS